MNALHASSAREGQLLPEIAQEVPGRQLLMTEEMFCDWLASAPPGQRLEYYRGLLAHDRVPSTKVLHERDRVTLAAVAKRAMQAAEDGRVLLLQRRHGNSDYSYIAVKASRRAPARSVGAGTALLRTVTPSSTGPDHPAMAKETSQCL
jgi:hypothetical protein